MAILQDKQELKVLSIEELKQFKELNDLSNEEAVKIINTLKELAFITYQITTNEQSKSVFKFCKAE